MITAFTLAVSDRTGVEKVQASQLRDHLIDEIGSELGLDDIGIQNLSEICAGSFSEKRLMKRWARKIVMLCIECIVTESFSKETGDEWMFEKV